MEAGPDTYPPLPLPRGLSPAGLRRGERRNVRDVVDERGPADVVRIGFRLGAQGRVDDEGDLSVLDEVGDVRPPLVDLEDRFRRDVVPAQEICGAPGGRYAETALMEHPGRTEHPGLVLVADAEEHFPLSWKHHPRCDLRLGERPPELGVDPHHFAGRFHLGAENRVDVRELDEGKDGLLDADVLRYDGVRQSELGQLPADHDLGGQFRQRDPDRLAYEGDGSGGAGVDFQDENLPLLDGELHVHQPHHAEFLREDLRLADDLPRDFGGNGIRRQGARGIARVHPRLLDVLHHGPDEHVGPVADRIDVDLDRTLQEAVDEDRMVRRCFRCRAHEALELVRVVHDLHGPTPEDVGGAHHHRIPDPLGDPAGLGERPRLAVRRRWDVEFAEQLGELPAVLREVDRLGPRAEHPEPLLLERARQREGALPSELHDDTLRLLRVTHGEHVFG
jgi:hypothetical protein